MIWAFILLLTHVLAFVAGALAFRKNGAKVEDTINKFGA